MTQFSCTQLHRERCYSILPKILVMILPPFLLHGIVQNFACNVIALKGDIDIIFAIIDC